MIIVSRYVSLVILISVFLSYARSKLLHLDTIFLRYYNNTLVDFVDEKLDNIQFLVSKMDTNKPTVLYIHGFREDVENKSVSTVVCGKFFTKTKLQIKNRKTLSSVNLPPIEIIKKSLLYSRYSWELALGIIFPSVSDVVNNFFYSF
ncbi:uncharacterized protein LOC122521475 [Polistes fuscatus]|uniref:uncharacterized protein LOC122521475 n=1 Tax=Polistes fuscatus TaxID=30207 RepID=UPI001CA9C3A6|nr:uncharacterized protein LOC122521475 [Polistes fuscatus]